MNKYYYVLFMSVISLLTTCTTAKREAHISFQFYRMVKHGEFEPILIIPFKDIEICDWDKQIFKINNTNLIKELNTMFFKYSATNAYLQILNYNKLLYKVTIIPPMAPSYYDYDLPRLFLKTNASFTDGDKIFINFKVNGIPSDILKIKKFFKSKFIIHELQCDMPKE